MCWLKQAVGLCVLGLVNLHDKHKSNSCPQNRTDAGRKLSMEQVLKNNFGPIVEASNDVEI